MRIAAAAATHPGRRPDNEDAVLVSSELGLFAVADGMGGYEGGEVASATVVAALEQFFERVAKDPDATWPVAIDRDLAPAENLVRAAICVAHAAVCEKKRGALAQMGSTVAALAFRGDEVVVGHVGDSRAYRLRGGVLAALTRDHSFYEELRQKGAPELGPKSSFPYGNVITRALGMPGSSDAELLREAARPGDVYLLCTDGLVEGLAEPTLAALLASPVPPQEVCCVLVEGALAAGTRDNVSVVVVRVLP